VKAFLLAAGIGSRLRPLTDTTPKAMLEIGGRPLLGIWLDEMDRAGVTEVLVNLHHLPEVVQAYMAGRTGPPAVRLVLEPALLGSAGTLAANRDWLGEDDFFLAANADNLTDFDLATLIQAHRGSGAAATLTAFRSPSPSAGGVLEAGQGGWLASFAEKPAHPVSDLVNAGIYAFSTALLGEIGPPPADIGYDLLPGLVGRARVLPVPGYFRDIGTPESYRLAREEWPVRASR
jgi:mannose-1-phosphate guanylyltransferase